MIHPTVRIGTSELCRFLWLTKLLYTVKCDIFKFLHFAPLKSDNKVYFSRGGLWGSWYSPIHSFIHLEAEKRKFIQFVEPTRLYPGTLDSDATTGYTPLQSHVLLVLSYHIIYEICSPLWKNCPSLRLKSCPSRMKRNVVPVHAMKA